MAGEEGLFGRDILKAIRRIVDQRVQPDNLTIFRNPAGKLAARASSQLSGDWTPVFAPVSANADALVGGTIQYSLPNGRWTRINQMVFLTGQMSVIVTVMPTAGGLVIGGLPFPSATYSIGTLQVNNLRFPPSYPSAAFAAMSSQLFCATAQNSTMVLGYIANNASSGILSRSALNPAATSSIDFNFSIVYEAT